MIDAFYIFTKGGLLLWSTQLVKVKGDPIDRLIKEVLLEERVGETFTNIQVTDTTYSLKWKLLNDIDLFLVVVYTGIQTLAYLEGLLADAAKQFLSTVDEMTSGGGLSSLKPPYTVDFQSQWVKVLAKADKELKEAKRRPQMKSFEDTNKGKKIMQDKDEPAKPKKKKSKDGKDEGDSDEEGDSDGKVDDDAVEEARKKLKAKAKSGPGKFQPKEKKEKDTEDGDVEKKKSSKEARSWDPAHGNGKLSKGVMKTLDFSKGERPDEDNDDEMIQKAKAEYLEGSGDDAFDDGEASSIDADSDDEKGDEKEEEKTGRVGGLFKSLTRNVKNLTGGAVLADEDLAPLLKTFKTSLMSKNVGVEVADKLAESVRTSLVGKTTDRFTSMSATVKNVLKDAIERQLTPKKSIDVLRAAMAAKNAGRVYSIVFLGVNGVGKSTNLAKVAYYLKHKGGLNVLICACDTFRAGAVEQLKTHSRCLDVPLFERGYGKDPAEIAKSAIAHARTNGHDVVLVDTAGRMQDNEPLMRALAKLVAINTPDLVLFVGEALVGNDAIDQVSKFNRSLIDMSHDPRNPRGIDGMLLTKYDTVDDKVGAALSMVYVTGQPIVFVGCGQKYTHLRKLYAKDVVKTLLG
jgi:signal recognition particle receptor subunit alpha